MRKLLLAVLLSIVSFSILLGANQEAHAGFSCGVLEIPNGDGSSCTNFLAGVPCTTWTCNAGFTESGTDPKCDVILGTAMGVYSGTFQCLASPDNGQVIGGEIMSIDSTALYIAGTQTSASWIIPAVLSAAGIGLVLVKRK